MSRLDDINNMITKMVELSPHIAAIIDIINREGDTNESTLKTLMRIIEERNKYKKLYEQTQEAK